MQCKNEMVWNTFFFFLYGALATTTLWYLYAAKNIVPSTIPLSDLVIIIFATFRLTRLFVYDRVTLFIRNIFEEKVKKNDCYRSGLKASLHHLFLCTWCVGIWISLPVVFLYFLTPLMWFPILLLAVAGMASLLQIAANAVGWSAENLKLSAEEKERL